MTALIARWECSQIPMVLHYAPPAPLVDIKAVLCLQPAPAVPRGHTAACRGSAHAFPVRREPSSTKPGRQVLASARTARKVAARRLAKTTAHPAVLGHLLGRKSHRLASFAREGAFLLSQGYQAATNVGKDFTAWRKGRLCAVPALKGQFSHCRARQFVINAFLARLCQELAPRSAGLAMLAALTRTREHQIARGVHLEHIQTELAPVIAHCVTRDALRVWKEA
mmetsp:Transcript_26157/g.68819  ORF Transcript_26157/g.68819 Transcript_26157/m.68819 type:complete len:224 (-) Transcript_26157:497-1168(-)